MLFAEVAAASGAISGTTAKSVKTRLLAAVVSQADRAEVEPVVSFLSGELAQRKTGVGWASIRSMPAPAAEPSLTVLQVHDAFETIAAQSGPGSQGSRRDLLSALLSRATEPEQRVLRGLVAGELRQGASAALVVDAVAAAARVPVQTLRRAVMLRGAVGPVAAAALAEGTAGLSRFVLQVGRPVQPMLAQTATTVAQAMERFGTAVVEWKVDGVRVQIHRAGPDIRVFTRSLDDITDRLPEVVEMIRGLPVGQLVVDAEAIALRADGRPQPFQVTGSRVGSRVDVTTASRRSPLSLFAFDLLHQDGRDLLDEPAADRMEALAQVLPIGMRVPRLITADRAAADAFLAAALAAGHEGVVVKSLEAPYAAGRRGSGWLKVKPVHTLDLVVLAAEWGHGRRSGWLSNLHLGARGRDGGFVMLGKTFKGMTDVMLAEQTERLLRLEESRNDWQVFVRPELVVEVAFDGVQSSTRYPGGMALRFARIVRYRPDKSPVDADDVDRVRAFLDAEGSREGSVR